MIGGEWKRSGVPW